MFQDVAISLPRLHVDTVFDVGANVGQSCEVYLRAFPKSHVHCFEPVAETFATLHQRMRGQSRVSCHRFALGAANAHEQMATGAASDLSYRLNSCSDELGTETNRIEEVEVRKLDNFCTSEGIQHIGLLKIDTEGNDLDVLKGASAILSAENIDLVQVEAGMNPENMRHVPFHNLNEFLLSHRYSLFGIYDQVHEWPTGAPNLRRINPLFISSKIVQLHRSILASRRG